MSNVLVKKPVWHLDSELTFIRHEPGLRIAQLAYSVHEEGMVDDSLVALIDRVSKRPAVWTVFLSWREESRETPQLFAGPLIDCKRFVTLMHSSLTLHNLMPFGRR